MSEPIKCKDCVYRKTHLAYLESLDSHCDRLIIEHKQMKLEVAALDKLMSEAERKDNTQGQQTQPEQHGE